MPAEPRRSAPPFAPPFLKDGKLLIGQTAAILHYLGPTLKLVARSEQARVWTQQIQLTIADMVTEAHDTHHPMGVGLYYEDQKPEALRRAQVFCRAAAAEVPALVRGDPQRNPAGSATWSAAS
jgi:glutathione S-transferase